MLHFVRKHFRPVLPRESHSFGCCPKRFPADLHGPSCRWWTHRRAKPRPSYQALTNGPLPQTWIQDWGPRSLVQMRDIELLLSMRIHFGDPTSGYWSGKTQLLGSLRVTNHSTMMKFQGPEVRYQVRGPLHEWGKNKTACSNVESGLEWVEQKVRLQQTVFVPTFVFANKVANISDWN